MRTSIGRLAAAGLAICCVAPAAASAKISALPNINSQFRKGSDTIAKAIADKPREVVHGSFSMLPPGGRPVALSTTRLAGFPRQGKSYAIFSTGDARLASKKNHSGALGRGDGGPFLRGARDVTIFRIDLRVPSNASCLSFRFKFLTEEFAEFVGSEFNDAFIAELGDSTWNATSNQDPTIVAPDDFALDPNKKLISVNAAGAASVSAANAKGTTYDGATPILRASTPVKPGRRTLYLSIFDQGDRQYDSAVFVDHLTLDRRSPCTTGVTVD